MVTPPTQEPISLATAKAHLRVDVPDDDVLISSYITSARDALEDNYEIALLTQTQDLFLDSFPGLAIFPWQTTWQLHQTAPIEIPMPPLQSVTSITYTDFSGAATVWPSTNYVVDAATFTLPRIVPAFTQTWPTPTLQPVNGVAIRCVLGFGATGTALPGKVIQAMLLMIGHFYENREQVLLEQRIRPIDIPRGVDDLMAPLNWKRALVA